MVVMRAQYLRIRDLRTRILRTTLAATALLASAVMTLSPASSVAADPSDYLSANGQHRLFSADMPPGAVARARVMRGGPVAGYFQPVAITGPQTAKFALAAHGTFQAGEPKLMAGLQIGHVYRFRVTGIAGRPGAELFPTIEMIDRTYPPPGLATSYPIPINLDAEDLQAALDGQLVTRVIYLEDPQTALPVPEKPETSRVMDVAEHQDALRIADRFGRPVAIVRIGSLMPPTAEALKPHFFFGHPAWAPIFAPETAEATVTTPVSHPQAPQQ